MSSCPQNQILDIGRIDEAVAVDHPVVDRIDALAGLFDHLGVVVVHEVGVVARTSDQGDAGSKRLQGVVHRTAGQRVAGLDRERRRVRRGAALKRIVEHDIGGDKRGKRDVLQRQGFGAGQGDDRVGSHLPGGGKKACEGRKPVVLNPQDITADAGLKVADRVRAIPLRNSEDVAAGSAGEKIVSSASEENV